MISEPNEMRMIRIAKLFEAMEIMISNATHARILLHIFWVSLAVIGSVNPLLVNAGAKVILKLLVHFIWVSIFYLF